MKKILFSLSIVLSINTFASNKPIKAETNNFSTDLKIKYVELSTKQKLNFNRVNEQNCFPVTFTGEQGTVTFQWCDTLEKLEVLIKQFLNNKPKTKQLTQS